MSRRCLSAAIRQIASGSSSRLPKASNDLALSTGSQSRNNHSYSPVPNTHRSTQDKRLTVRNYATQTLKFNQSKLSVEDYQKLSDQTFDSLTDYLEELTQEYDGEDADDYEVEYANGVLNLRLSNYGTYVINKQPANKQIWFSSPTSGPKRFDFDEKHEAWFMLKDGEETNLRDLLDNELSQIFGKEVKVNLGERS